AAHLARYRARAEPGAEPGQRALRLGAAAPSDPPRRGGDGAAPAHVQDAVAARAPDSFARASPRPGQPADRDAKPRSRPGIRVRHEPRSEPLDSRRLSAAPAQNLVRDWCRAATSVRLPAG